jgi:Asp/Glu/hydantoin racemase
MPMLKRLALLHTVSFLADMFRTLLQERLPNLEHFHLVDEGIIRELMAQGQLTPKVIRRIATQAFLAQESGAELILFTCSSTSPAVDAVRNFIDIPILKIDEPMAKQAVGLGETIGVVATAKTTQQPSIDLIESIAKERKRKVRVQSVLESAAFQAKLAGDNNTHDQLVKNAVHRLAQDNDVVILAQASMAHLAEPLGKEVQVPVLASPEFCIRELEERFKRKV